jgi:hypothetical protein
VCFVVVRVFSATKSVQESPISHKSVMLPLERIGREFGPFILRQDSMKNSNMRKEISYRFQIKTFGLQIFWFSTTDNIDKVIQDTHSVLAAGLIMKKKHYKK